LQVGVLLLAKQLLDGACWQRLRVAQKTCAVPDVSWLHAAVARQQGSALILQLCIHLHIFLFFSLLSLTLTSLHSTPTSRLSTDSR
jgi:hypothetical protein